MCQAFSLFLLVYEKTHPKVGQWIIFVVASGVKISWKKYFEFRKSLTPFYALITEEHFGQISLKSGKSTYRINSFEDGEICVKAKAMFSALKHFQSFRMSLKSLSMRSCRRPIKHKEAFPVEFYR